MTHFVAIVEQRSLTAAARRLHTSLPTVVRTLAGLEAALGVRLLNRTTRRIAVTDEGRQYYEHCKRVLTQMAEAERALSDRKLAPGGRLVVTAPVLFGRWHVAPRLVEFAAAYPNVSVELLLLDRVTNLTEEGIDVALRIGRLSDSSLIAVPVGETERVVCASPAYITRHGAPLRPEQLSQHACVRYIDVGAWQEWQFSSRGKSLVVSVKGPFDTNQLEAAVDACAAGLGIGQFLAYQVRERVHRGELVPILQKFGAGPLPIHVVYPHARLLSARVRTFVDFLVAQLRESPATRLDWGSTPLLRPRRASISARR